MRTRALIPLLVGMVALTLAATVPAGADTAKRAAPFHYSLPHLVVRVPLYASLLDVSSNGREVLYAHGPNNGRNNLTSAYVYDRKTHHRMRVYRIPSSKPKGSFLVARFLTSSRVLVNVWAPHQLIRGWGIDAYVRDIRTGHLTNISRNSDGQLANGSTEGGEFDPTSNSIVLASYATNLVSHPSFVGGSSGSNQATYLKNLTTGGVTQIDLGGNGKQVSQKHLCTLDAIAPRAGRALYQCAGAVTSSSLRRYDIGCYIATMSTGVWRLVSTGSKGAALHTVSDCTSMSLNWKRLLMTTLPGNVYRDGVKNLATGSWHLYRTMQGSPTPDWSRALYSFAGSKGNNQYRVSTLSGAHTEVVTRNAHGQQVNNGAFQGTFAKEGRLLFFDSPSFRGTPNNNLPGSRKGYDAIYVETSRR